MNSSTESSKRPLPLAGVKVLDVSQVMAGPYSCMLLADMGADVIKVEPPGGGDQTRGAMGFKMKGPDSMGFLNMNRNKRSIAINLKSEAGKSVLFKLVKEADILVVATGKPKMITASMVKSGAVVIDVGINRLPDGKLCGDVDFDEVKYVASAITPVPGGVGPMTITMLLLNTLEAAERVKA